VCSSFAITETPLRILYISQYFPPEMGAPAARAAELSRLWAREGHDVSVLTGFPNHPTGVVPAAYRKQLRRMFVREYLDGVDVFRTWLLPLPNRRSYERALNYSSFLLSAALAGSFMERPDVVIATSPQLLVGLAGWWISRLKGVPFVFEVRDLWPESLAAVGAGDPNSVLHRTLAAVANFLYRNADHIVVVTSAFKTYLVENCKVAGEKISVIENGVNTHLFSPHPPSEEIRRQIGAGGKFVVSYIGTMGMAHGLETVLDAARILQDRAPNVRFMLLGEGAEKQALVSRAISMGLDNVIFMDQQDREKVPAFICSSDVCLVMLKKAELFKTVLPSKLLEFMSCGRPVLLGVDGEARRIMDEAGAGLFVEPENADDLAEEIIQASTNPGLCEVLARNGRAYIVRRFSRQQTALRYIAVLENLLRRNEAHAAVAA
jgi:glycosyltransferase involved in cell wall biosynthesis